MNKSALTYIVFILFNSIYIVRGNACSDIVFFENYGTIKLRYTSYCPMFIDSDKLKDLSIFLRVNKR